MRHVCKIIFRLNLSVQLRVLAVNHALATLSLILSSRVLRGTLYFLAASLMVTFWSRTALMAATCRHYSTADVSFLTHSLWGSGQQKKNTREVQSHVSYKRTNHG